MVMAFSSFYASISAWCSHSGRQSLDLSSSSWCCCRRRFGFNRAMPTCHWTWTSHPLRPCCTRRRRVAMSSNPWWRILFLCLFLRFRICLVAKVVIFSSFLLKVRLQSDNAAGVLLDLNALPPENNLRSSPGKGSDQLVSERSRYVIPDLNYPAEESPAAEFSGEGRGWSERVPKSSFQNFFFERIGFDCGKKIDFWTFLSSNLLFPPPFFFWRGEGLSLEVGHAGSWRGRWHSCKFGVEGGVYTYKKTIYTLIFHGMKCRANVDNCCYTLIPNIHNLSFFFPISSFFFVFLAVFFSSNFVIDFWRKKSSV